MCRDERVIAKELPPECVDFSLYFDFCFGQDVRVEDLIFIPGIRLHEKGFNKKEYQDIVLQAQNIMQGYDYTDLQGAIEDAGLEYSKDLHSKLEEWAKSVDTNKVDMDIEDIANYLTVITGMGWETASFNGYVQGSHCTVLYCADKYDTDTIKELGKMYVGCGTEFEIDNCRGYFVTDTILWKGGSVLRDALAKIYGCNPKDLDVYRFVRYKTTPIYKKMEQ